MSGNDETKRIDMGATAPVGTTTPPPHVHVPDTRTRVDPLQWIGWPLGGAMVVWSLVALARAGFDGFAPYEAVEVAGLSTSRLLAVIVGILGLLIWGGIAGDRARDVEIRVIGAVAIVLGAVFLIEPAPFRPYLGIDSDFGGVALVVGLILGGLSMTHPFPIGRDPNR